MAGPSPWSGATDRSTGSAGPDSTVPLSSGASSIPPPGTGASHRSRRLGPTPLHRGHQRAPDPVHHRSGNGGPHRSDAGVLGGGEGTSAGAGAGDPSADRVRARGGGDRVVLRAASRLRTPDRGGAAGRTVGTSGRNRRRSGEPPDRPPARVQQRRHSRWTGPPLFRGLPPTHLSPLPPRGRRCCRRWASGRGRRCPAPCTGGRAGPPPRATMDPVERR